MASSGTESETSTRYTVHAFSVVAVRARRDRPSASSDDEGEMRSRTLITR
jgi:hypothetical protein